MWPFSKIDKLETELDWIRHELQRMNDYNSISESRAIEYKNNMIAMLHMQNDVAEQRYENICRVLDIIVLEHRDSVNQKPKESLLS